LILDLLIWLFPKLKLKKKTKFQNPLDSRLRGNDMFFSLVRFKFVIPAKAGIQKSMLVQLFG